LPFPRGRGAKLALFSVLGLVFLTIASGVALFTFPLPAFLVERPLIAAIEKRLGGIYSVEIGKAIVEAGAGGLDLRLDEFEIRDGEGRAVMRVPSASIALDGNLLFASQVGLRQVRLSEPRLVLRIDERGGVSFAGEEGAPPLFSLSGEGSPQGAPAPMLGLLAAGGAMLSPQGVLANFESAEISRATIMIDDRRRGRIDRIQNVDLKVSQREDGERLVASASSSDPASRWNATATLSGRPDQPRDLDIGFENLPLQRIVYEGLGGSTIAEGQLFGHVYAKIEPDGSMPSAEARIEMAGLKIAPGAQPQAAIAVQRSRLQLSWSGIEQKWRVGPSDFHGERGRVTLTGEARPLSDDGMRWAFLLEGTEEGDLPEAERVHRIAVEGDLDRRALSFAISRAEVRGASLDLAGNGRVSFASGVPELDVALSVSRAPIGTLTRLWPAPVAFSARKWLIDHVAAGTIDKLSVAVKGSLVAGEDLLRVAVDGAFTDATIDVLDGAPPVTGANGSVRVKDRVLTVEVGRGRVEVEPGQRGELTNFRFLTRNLGRSPLVAEIESGVEGDVAAFVKLIASGSLLALPQVPMRLDTASGQFKGSFRVAGPLDEPAGRRGRLDLSAKGRLSNLGLPLPSGLQLSRGGFDLDLTNASFGLRGQADLSGAPLVVEGLVARKPDLSLGELTAAFTVDPSKIKGVSLGDIDVRGPVSARLKLPTALSLQGGEIEADLSGASLKGLPGLDKRAGQAGTVAFKVKEDADSVHLDSFRAQGDGLDIRGEVEMTDAGALKRARFDSFKLSASDDARLDVTRTGGGYKVVARGSALDARILLRDILAGGDGQAKTDLDLEAKIGTVLGHNGEAIAGLDLKMLRRGDEVRNIQLSGLLGRGGIEGRSIEGSAQSLGIRSADAGAVLRFFDVYTRVQGGQMQLEFIPGKPGRGFLGISDFRVSGERALANVKRDQKAASGGYSFSKLRAVFRQTQERIVVDDAAVWGPDLGATIEGEINYGSDEINVRGTFVPAYALNNLFGRLPIIGNILGGAQEGLVGITYQVDGPIASPQLRVNPLSAVAPGFLRKLFEFREQDPQARPSQ
jgi:hypothetical protein